MGLLNKDQILEASDLQTFSVSVPEWGGDVQIRSMTGADRDEFESSLVKVDAAGNRSPDMSNHKAKLVAMTLVDESGNRMFTHDDVARLATKSSAALNRVYEAAQKLNGIGAAAESNAEKN